MELVQAAFRAFEDGDMEGVLRFCDENIEITQDAKLLGAPGRQHGHAGVREAFALWPDLWDDFRVEVLHVSDFGDHIMVATVNRGRGKGSGVPVEMPFTFLFSVRAGKIAKWRLFMSEEQALEAARQLEATAAWWQARADAGTRASSRHSSTPTDPCWAGKPQ